MQEFPSAEPPALRLNAAIEVFAADCDRIKMMTSLMESPPRSYDENWEKTILTALRVDIPRLLADEAEDLLPILELAARKTDDIEDILKRLRGDHVVLRSCIAASVNALDAPGDDPQRAIGTALTSGLAAIAARMRQHVSLLSAVILPIARLRLTPADLSALGAGLASRRIG